MEPTLAIRDWGDVLITSLTEAPQYRPAELVGACLAVFLTTMLIVYGIGHFAARFGTYDLPTTTLAILKMPHVWWLFPAAHAFITVDAIRRGKVGEPHRARLLHLLGFLYAAFCIFTFACLYTTGLELSQT